MAQQTVSYFHKSFALTSKLNVSLAFSKKEGPPLTSEYRPWSKHSAGSSRNQKLQEQQQQQTDEATNSKTQKDTEVDGDELTSTKESDQVRRKREEFLSAMGVSDKHGKDSAVGKSKFWANDDVVADPIDMNDGSNDAKDESDGSDEDNGNISSSSESDLDAQMMKTSATNEKNSKGKEVSSDLDFLKSKQVKADIFTDEDEDHEVDDEDDGTDSSSSNDSDGSSGENSSEEENEVQQEESSAADKGEEKDQANKDQPSITLADRLFVRNLPFTTTEEELFETFSQFGSVAAVHIPVDDTKRNKGYAFISYQSKHDAKLAIDTMDGEDFQGRLIHILPARPSNESDADGNNANLTYKERQALARQKEAENATQSWSASFLRGDTVVDNISDRLGVSKGDVLNVKDGISSGNAAVRLALGETHIIAENIAFFEMHGVDVRALESKKSNSSSDKGGGGSASKRSATTILVKNLPYDTSLEELTKAFHSIGGDAPRRILLPPSKTAALVEYDHATDARRAFRRLAYKKFKHVPLYLEWAPMMDAVKKKDEAVENGTSDNVQMECNNDHNTVKKDLMDADDHNADAENTQTIYVKNLNFNTSEDELKRQFTSVGFVPRAVKIPTKAAPMKRQSPADDSETKLVSMGYGFVEFVSEEEAKKAMKALQGKLVDGHSLDIKLSNKSLSSSKSSAPTIDKASKNTKIMIRNIPFEATRSEILQLFGTFGQLKKVRLPKKFDGTHRGFGFCEFLTSKEAQNAMATLSRTHLYGRHLVLEWASNEETVDGKVDVGMVREKAKRDATRGGLGGAGAADAKKVKRQHKKFD